jgi:putative transcriptional regulator
MPRINVREIRKSRGWTQEELARRVGVSNATAAKWDQGIQPSAINALKLARALGCTIEDLFTAPDDDPDSGT